MAKESQTLDNKSEKNTTSSDVEGTSYREWKKDSLLCPKCELFYEYKGYDNIAIKLRKLW
ncbi:hypothetical protein BM86_34525 [Bacillus thuringiensis]|nr:hypothetical protein [Bacillus thuringiensis]